MGSIQKIANNDYRALITDDFSLWDVYRRESK